MKVYIAFLLCNKIKQKSCLKSNLKHQRIIITTLKSILAIKNVNDNRYDMFTHKNSKYLFYNFNNYLNRTGIPVQFVRHTLIYDDNYALTILQEKYWQYSIEIILEVSERGSLQLEQFR